MDFDRRFGILAGLEMSTSELGIAIIGCGGITLQNHLPGLAMCRGVKAVALCDTNETSLQRANTQTGINTISTDYRQIVQRDDVHAVIVATPNVSHAEIALAAIAAGKHVLCEKPIAMNYSEARRMYETAEKAGVRHMTAFTYRFVPGMRYLAHLSKSGALGKIYHYRSCRLQDWGDRALGWRQVAKLAGSGEMGDMLSHRIDFSHLLVGAMVRIVADMKRLIDSRQGNASDLEDWVAILAEFQNGASGVLESSKLATGRNESWRSQDYVEVNGSEASYVFFTERWNELQVGKKGGSGLEKITIPREFWVWPGSPRDPANGDPLVTFRYDQTFEFIDAIRNQRPCVPSFFEGMQTQAVIEAAQVSARERRWVNMPEDYANK